MKLELRPPGWVNLYVLWMKGQSPEDLPVHSAALRVGAGSTRAVRMVTNSSPAVG